MVALAAGVAVLAAPFLAGQEIPKTVFSEWKDRVDPAVERGLEFLAAAQEADGTFPENYGTSTGIPALVGMAFLSKGHLPTEPKFGEEINRCIDFILRHQNRDGLFSAGHAGSGPMYAHNIATLFLSEVSGMVDPQRQEAIARGLPRALQLILRAQRVEKPDQHRGGWRYHPGSRDSDTSCSGWALMALRSAKLNGANVPDKAIADAVEYLYRHHDPREGCFGYSNRDSHKYSLTGMGLLCLELCGEHGKEATFKAGEFVLRNHRRLEGNQFEFYGNYYNAQGMFQLGGKYWETYANWMYSQYLPQQREDGSWHSREAGRVYGTAMMTLAFTVPYRQLPIYQRDETVDED
ncbi:MAG: terpene cyclase/mutase family protein [Akkermansiaceae bacterium]|nr:terpene cyclase/mutase family protein [Akkermansiaceae bacterium]